MWADWKPLFDAWEAPWELIRTVYDVRDDPQVIANEMIYDVRLSSGRDLMLVAGPVSVDGHPFPETPKRAPALAQHTDELLQSLGYSTDKITALKKAGALQ